MYFTDTAALTVKVGGCLIKGFTGTYGNAIRTNDADVTLTVINTTCAECNLKGINNSAGSITLTNVAVVNCGDDLNGTITENYVLTEDD